MIRTRRAIALHYMTERARYNAAGQHVMKPYIRVADGEKLAGEAGAEHRDELIVHLLPEGARPDDHVPGDLTLGGDLDVIEALGLEGTV